MDKKIMRTVLLEQSDLEKVKEIAKIRGCSENAVIRGLIRKEASL